MPAQKYLVFLRRGPGKQEPPAPAQMQEMYASFNAWKEKFKANIVDIGGQLKPGGKVVRTSGITDGPFAEAKEIVGGYMVVAAESYDRAIEVARGCPGIVSPGGSVEIREIA
ncbi:MAG TPA: YciI family protein [Gemmatimonadales bacterium]|nr:YciI family protein [Gemmatimonadales bacterium]